MFSNNINKYITAHLNKKNILTGVAVLLVLVVVVFLQERYITVTPQELQEWIVSYGWYAYAVYLLFAIVRPLVLFPITIYYLAGGLAFGAVAGGLLALVGAAIGATVAHQLAYHSEGKLLPKLWRDKINGVKMRIDNHSFRNMLFIRLIPAISFDLLSYAAGLARLHWRTFMAATIIGTSPRIVAYAYVGANALDVNSRDFWIAITVLTVVVLTPLIIYRYLNLRKHRNFN